MYNKVKRINKSKKEHVCDTCKKIIPKGRVYYRQKTFVVIGDDVPPFSFESKHCPKCKFTRERKEARFDDFKQRCEHPEEFICTIGRYIPGECIMEPDYEECGLCGAKI